MIQNDFIEVEAVLSEIVINTDDADFKKGVPKARYISWIQKAMQELAKETFYFKVTLDVDMPQNAQYKLPENIFNIRELYAYDGDICAPSATQNLYYKRLFNNMSDGKGYTAKVKDRGFGTPDLFVANYPSNFREYTGRNVSFKYAWNEIGGILMVSSDVLKYPYLRIVSNTYGVTVGENPIIPRAFERAVVDWVCVRFYTMMVSRDVRLYSPLLSIHKQSLEGIYGSWNQAKKFVKSMDTAKKEAMEEYMSSMIHK